MDDSRGGDSARKRSLIRSPLELLAEERTPPPMQKSRAAHTQASAPASSIAPAATTTAAASSSSVINVTRTTTNSREVIPFGHSHTSKKVQQEATPQEDDVLQHAGGSDMPHPLLSSVPLPTPRLSDAMPQEPSTLLFMSPQHAKPPRSGSSHARRLSSQSSEAMTATTTETPSAVVTLEEAHAMAREALEAYELHRDEEETQVLEQVRLEMQALTQERDAVLAAYAAAQDQEGQSKELVAQLERQCQMLTAATHSIHDELQQERARVGQLEIQVCHAEDAKQSALAEHIKERERDGEQFHLEKLEWEKECEGLRYTTHETKAELLECSARLDASKKQNSVLTAQLEDVQARRLSLEQENQFLKGELQEKSALVQSLSKRAKSLETSDAGKRETVAAHVQRIATLEESLKTQTDDVRKKMYRIQQLEAEVHRQQEVNSTLQGELNSCGERAEMVHGMVESLWSTLRRGASKHVTRISGNDGGATIARGDPNMDELDMDELYDHSDEDEDEGTAGGTRQTSSNKLVPLHVNKIGQKKVSDKSKMKLAAVPRKLNTLHTLTSAHECVHALLRRLHLKGVTEVEKDKERTESMTQLQRRATELMESERQVKAEQDALRHRVVQLEALLASRDRDVQANRQDSIAQLEELKRARESLKREQEKTQRLEFTVEELRSERDAATLLSKDSQTQHAALLQEKAVLEQRIRDMQAPLEDLKKVSTTKDKALDDAERTAAQYAREVADVTMQRDRVQKQVTRLHAELAHVRSESNKMQQEFDVLQQRLTKSEHALQASRKSSVSRAAAAMSEKQADLLSKELEQQRQHHHEEIQQLQSQLDEKQTKLTQAADALDKYRHRLGVVTQSHHQEATDIVGRMMNACSLLRQYLSGAVASVPAPKTLSDLVAATTPQGATSAGEVVLLSPFPSDRRANSNPNDVFTPQPAERASQRPMMTEAVASLPTEKRSGTMHAKLGDGASSTMITVAEAMRQLETQVRCTVDNATFLDEQHRAHIRSMQQTIAFLELEIRCQASQLRQAPSSSSITPAPARAVSGPAASERRLLFAVKESDTVSPAANVTREGDHHLSSRAATAHSRSLTPPRAPAHVTNTNTERGSSPTVRPPQPQSPAAPKYIQSRSSSTSSRDGGLSSVSVGGTSSSLGSRSVDGLSASPQRPPSLRCR